ncbi:putative quinol monooxygenase [Zhongshania arctica]|uniref:Quinol monooxygenase n=1 Tax=Zhongshania arctica TaxID=3238302 RepID=A0ABV3TRL4_9GAMM
MSVKVMLEVQSKPECIDDLKATFESTLPDTRSYEGCINLQVIGNQDDPLNIVLLETWETRKHYEKYLTWRAESGSLEALGSMLSKAPSIRYFDELDI